MVKPLTISVVIATTGRETLEHTLRSIQNQALIDGDEVFVIRDSHGDPDDRSGVCRRVERFGAPFQYLEYDAGYHFYGVAQSNRGYALACGDVLLSLGDDDVYVDGAFARLRAVMVPDPLRPVLFQFLAPWRQVLWDRPEMRKSHISGQCIAVPRSAFVPYNEVARYVEVDFDWMQAVLAKSGRDPLWLDEVLVLARPELRVGRPVTGVTHCPDCYELRYIEDVTSDGRCVECATLNRPRDVTAAFRHVEDA